MRSPRLAEVRESDEFYEVYENGRLVLRISKEFDVFEVLADLGFDVAIKDGRKFDLISIKSLVRKVKSAEGVEECGAIAIFVGFVRRISDGKEVVRLEFEKFGELYEIKLEEIKRRVMDMDGVVGVEIYHKVGSLKPGEDILYVVVMGRHRKHTFKALEECVELIKKELPIWKKEVYEDGAVWVHDKRSNASP